MHLDKDLYSIDGVLLVRRRQEITRKVLAAITKNAPKKVRLVKIGDTFLARDLKRPFKERPYKVIFSSKKDNEQSLKRILKETIPWFVFEELKFIKKNLPYTYRHVLLVTMLSMKVALDKRAQHSYNPKMVPKIGLVHDIGKTRIPARVLDKRSPLTREQLCTIKTHPLIGYVLLRHYYAKDHDKYDHASYEHHEQLDGTGYPRGIKHLDKYSQLIAVIDRLDALVSYRPYRHSSYALRAAIDVLINEADKGKINKNLLLLLVSYARKDKPRAKDITLAVKKRDKGPLWSSYGKIAKKRKSL